MIVVTASRTIRSALLLLAMAACDDRPAPAPATSDTAAAPVPVPIDPAQAEAVRERLQGTWSMSWWRGDSGQHPEVWSIAGDTLTRWDGTKEEAAKLTVIAPCLMKVQWASGSNTLEEFVIDGDDVYFAQAGGRTDGARTVVCAADGAWVLEGGECHAWKQVLMRPTRSDLSHERATCSIAADGAFEAEGKRFPRRGDVFVADDFERVRAKPATRFASLAEAKSALAGK